MTVLPLRWFCGRGLCGHSSLTLSVPGGAQHQDQPGGKVTVIGGGDLGMACVTSILAKVTQSDDVIRCGWTRSWFLILLLSSFLQCHVDKLVFIDVAESSTKGGSTDLEIFSLPKVTVSAGEHLRRRLGSSRNRRPHLVG